MPVPVPGTGSHAPGRVASPIVLGERASAPALVRGSTPLSSSGTYFSARASLEERPPERIDEREPADILAGYRAVLESARAAMLPDMALRAVPRAVELSSAQVLSGSITPRRLRRSSGDGAQAGVQAVREGWRALAPAPAPATVPEESNGGREASLQTAAQVAAEARRQEEAQIVRIMRLARDAPPAPVAASAAATLAVLPATEAATEEAQADAATKLEPAAEEVTEEVAEEAEQMPPAAEAAPHMSRPSPSLRGLSPTTPPPLCPSPPPSAPHAGIAVVVASASAHRDGDTLADAQERPPQPTRKYGATFVGTLAPFSMLLAIASAVWVMRARTEGQPVEGHVASIDGGAAWSSTAPTPWSTPPPHGLLLLLFCYSCVLVLPSALLERAGVNAGRRELLARLWCLSIPIIPLAVIYDDSRQTADGLAGRFVLMRTANAPIGACLMATFGVFHSMQAPALPASTLDPLFRLMCALITTRFALIALRTASLVWPLYGLLATVLLPFCAGYSHIGKRLHLTLHGAPAATAYEGAHCGIFEGYTMYAPVPATALP